MDDRCPTAPSSKGKWGNPFSSRSGKSWTFNRWNSLSGNRGNPDVPIRRVGWTQPLQGKTPVESWRATSFHLRGSDLEAPYAGWISIIERDGATWPS